jgi:hypothetical protein
MSNLAEYFRENRYVAKYHLGDRVRGLWNQIPFVGSVCIDTMIDEYEGSYALISVDLPIVFENITYTMIKIKPEEIERL